MSSVKHPAREFERKVRTFIRGMTALFAHRHVMNPFRYGVFAFALISHKILRWLAPVFLMTMLASSAGLAARSPFFLAVLCAQALFYLCAFAALVRFGRIDRSPFGAIALYFTTVNAAALMAWFKYVRGVRQELWTPSRR